VKGVMVVIHMTLGSLVNEAMVKSHVILGFQENLGKMVHMVKDFDHTSHQNSSSRKGTPNDELYQVI
jgi:hypothetical protein